MSETRFFEQQDGSKIAYKIFKSANVKNVIPLVGGTKEHFFGFEEELAKNQQVIVYDNRGIGESIIASPKDSFTIELLAQDTIGLIKHLGIKRFNLFGEAMGGRVALSVALNLPSDLKLEKLVVCTSSARVDTSTAIFYQMEQIYKLPSFEFSKTLQDQKDQILKSEGDKELVKYLLEHPDKLDKIAEIIFNTINPGRSFEIFKRQWEANKKCDLVSRLKEIKVPTLIVHGENDVIVPIQDSELLDREIPNTQFYRIPNVGHR
ncbi:35014_t:CDS:2 [Gigaspora margarita]|uniref:35014_t:CDS:1 n=1 Tax=Gigaspora margarita TaxID=4874 RepID=A0ABN7UFE9_GIGMA|nr:35014_t:CDS:2 [Gigaspora margarita]